MRRKVCIVTGTRAEYGLLYWLMRHIKEDKNLQLQIIATGAHLSPEFGLTYRAIEKDGFKIDEKVEMLLSSDTAIGIGKSMGLGTIGFAEAFDRLKPDIIAVLGDRFEVLCAAQAALVAKIPVAHIHGGEITQGAIDDAIRHSVTKMSHLHFVAAEPYRKRVVQLGEDPRKVFNFGAIGIDNIKKLKLLGKKEFEKSIGFTLGRPTFLVTYHPLTLSKRSSESLTTELLCALDEFGGAKIIFTMPNADADGRVIFKMIEEYAAKDPEKAVVYKSLGQLKYLSALEHVDAVVGNSSSGLIEAPALGKPAVNIGDRQKGRLRASTVIDCKEDRASIKAAVKKALSPQFQRSLRKISSPYGYGDCSYRIKEQLKKIDLDGIVMKRFHDIGA